MWGIRKCQRISVLCCSLSILLVILLYRRQLWPLRLETTIEVGKKAVSMKFQVRLNCFVSHFSEDIHTWAYLVLSSSFFFFFLIFYHELMFVSLCLVGVMNLMILTFKVEPSVVIAGRRQDSRWRCGSGGFYRFSECISWMIQCAKEHLLLCTLRESCAGFLHSPKNLFNSSKSSTVPQRKHPSTVAHLFLVQDDLTR